MSILRNSKLILIVLVFFVSILVSCKKDRSMEAVITVKMLADTTILIKNARIEMYKDDVKVIGYTNQSGEYRHTFDNLIQLDISVTKDTLKGIGVINLGEQGVDVKKTIYVF